MRPPISISMLLAAALLPAAMVFAQEPTTPPPAPAPAQQQSPNRQPQGQRPHWPPPRDGRSPGDYRRGRGPDGRGPGFPGNRPPPGRGMFPAAFDELAKMPTEQRDKALEADPHFSRMPPERQAEVRQRLEHFAAMTPEQQQMMRDRFTIMNGMGPQSRERMREIFPQWRKLPEDRRKLVTEEFRTMKAMSSADREKRLADPEFLKTYSPREQQILKDLTVLVR